MAAIGNYVGLTSCRYESSIFDIAASRPLSYCTILYMIERGGCNAMPTARGRAAAAVAAAARDGTDLLTPMIHCLGHHNQPLQQQEQLAHPS